MDKKQENSKKMAKTYHLGRVCQKCGEPIADQDRATKIHCSRWIDKFGVIHDCKRQKHALKVQPYENILLDYSAIQRETKRQIEKVIAAHGNEVSTEILNAYNINLNENLSFDYHSGLMYAGFLGFKIITNPKLNTHKIIKHEQL
ncbi:MAG: hypothetical protein ACO210_05845 [Sediminibacterium sp.]